MSTTTQAPRKQSSLHAVRSDEQPAKRAARSVTTAAAEGDRRDLLVAMRARVATAVQDPNTPARDLAALTRRLLEIAKEIEAIDLAKAQEAAESGEVPDAAFDSSAV